MSPHMLLVHYRFRGPSLQHALASVRPRLVDFISDLTTLEVIDFEFLYFLYYYLQIQLTV